MGAESFCEMATGKTAKEAFANAIEDAEYEYGHSGYTGTIAEKNSFIKITVPKGEDPRLFAHKLLDEGDPRIDSKWGPAGCITLKPSEMPGNVVYIFFGWASS